MRRILIIFLLLLIPLQLSWSAIASFCHYESGTVTKHIGHHQGQNHHQTGLDKADKNAIKFFSLIDTGCDCCHTCCTAIISVVQPISSVKVVFQAIFAPYQDSLMLYLSVRPERPKWVNLA